MMNGFFQQLVWDDFLKTQWQQAVLTQAVWNGYVLATTDEQAEVSATYQRIATELNHFITAGKEGKAQLVIHRGEAVFVVTMPVLEALPVTTAMQPTSPRSKDAAVSEGGETCTCQRKQQQVYRAITRRAQRSTRTDTGGFYVPSIQTITGCVTDDHIDATGWTHRGSVHARFGEGDGETSRRRPLQQ